MLLNVVIYFVFGAAFVIFADRMQFKSRHRQITRLCDKHYCPCGEAFFIRRADLDYMERVYGEAV